MPDEQSMTPENQRDEDLKKAKEIVECDSCLGAGFYVEQVSESECEQRECDACYHGIITYPERHEEVINRIADALTAQRQSWERELEATKDYARQLADKGIALEKEKAELERKLEYYQSQFNYYHTLAEMVTLDNDRWKAENEKMALGLAQYVEDKNRLTASLSAAHEAFNHVKKELEETALVGATQTEKLRIKEIWEFILEILKDPTGQLAFEKWKKMEAVVEAAREVATYVQCLDYNSSERMAVDDLKKALEALDAKGERE